MLEVSSEFDHVYWTRRWARQLRVIRSSTVSAVNVALSVETRASMKLGAYHQAELDLMEMFSLVGLEKALNRQRWPILRVACWLLLWDVKREAVPVGEMLNQGMVVLEKLGVGYDPE